VAVLLAAVLVAAGVLAATVGAISVSRSDATKARLSFNLASAEIASNLQLAIRQEEGLVISASAYAAANPHTTPARFAAWVASVRALERYPELEDLGLIVFVPRSGLSAFEARMLAHPVLPANRQPAGSRGVFLVEPAGARPFYCFATAGVVRSQVAVLPPGLDYCAVQPSLLQARDSGESSYVPFSEGSAKTLAVQTPIYSGGLPPRSVAARRGTFVGWLGESLQPGVVLSEALQGHPNVAVAFGYRAGHSNVVFNSGPAPAGAQTNAINLHNGWMVQTFVMLPSGGIFGDGSALTLLLGGTALSLLIALLVFVLATGRERALSLVREKTSELSYQAHHDSLTGLPNRKLVMECAEQMLGTSRIAAALYIDVDGFKQINDSLGHAAGDRLLRVVAQRLVHGVRDQDVVGRLGGDEFIVLLDSLGERAQPDAIAKRLIEALRTPVRLDDRSTSFISASVGIALGTDGSVDQLFRDADLALYAAKAAGKDRYVLFEPGLDAEPGEDAPARVPFAELWGTGPGPVT
jgi:diguanylate cyclase (GGDEF)-like protein